MKKLKTNSCRGELVKMIVQFVLKDYIFDSFPNNVCDELKENLQKQLNVNLNFKTEVSEITKERSEVLGVVYFKDEQDVDGRINFSLVEVGKPYIEKSTNDYLEIEMPDFDDIDDNGNLIEKN